VENRLGLPEFGDGATEFYALASGLPVALGYDRVVYGDHGPYIELSSHQICWSSFPTFIERPQSCFFDEYWTADGLIMLYSQRRDVANKPNPPKGPLSVQNNRPEGYANYLIGKFYLSCDPESIHVRRTGASQRRRRRPGRGQGSVAGGHSSAPEEKEVDCGDNELGGSALGTNDNELGGSALGTNDSSGDGQPSQNCQAEVCEVDASDDACASEDRQPGTGDGCAEVGSVPSAMLEAWASDSWDEEARHAKMWCEAEWSADEWRPKSSAWMKGTWKGCSWAESSDWWSTGVESWSASASRSSYIRKDRSTTSRPPARWAPKQAQEEPPKESAVTCSDHEDPTEDQDASAKVADESRHQAVVLEGLHAGEGGA